MNIAVVDVAAKSGGALSVLVDFLSYLSTDLEAKNHVWYVFTSVPVDICCDHIKVIVNPTVKKSWFHRLLWEKKTAPKLFEKYEIDVVVSLQNTGFTGINIKQIVYFHNALLLEDKNKYSLFKGAERKYAVYVKWIAPYTLRSMKRVDGIVVQTQVIKNKIYERIGHGNIQVIRPNVNIPEERLEEDAYHNPVLGMLYPAASVPFKQMEEIVECVKNNSEWYRENNFEVCITIDGTENEYAQRIRMLAEDEPAIKLIGYQSREYIFDMYKNHALFINSSIESYPLLFEEVYAIGAPIVAAAYDYAIEIIGNKENICLFPPHDLTKMQTAIEGAQKKHVSGPRSFNNRQNTWEKVKCLILEN